MCLRLNRQINCIPAVTLVYFLSALLKVMHSFLFISYLLTLTNFIMISFNYPCPYIRGSASALEVEKVKIHKRERAILFTKVSCGSTNASYGKGYKIG